MDNLIEKRCRIVILIYFFCRFHAITDHTYSPIQCNIALKMASHTSTAYILGLSIFNPSHFALFIPTSSLCIGLECSVSDSENPNGFAYAHGRLLNSSQLNYSCHINWTVKSFDRLNVVPVRFIRLQHNVDLLCLEKSAHNYPITCNRSKPPWNEMGAIWCVFSEIFVSIVLTNKQQIVSIPNAIGIGATRPV